MNRKIQLNELVDYLPNQKFDLYAEYLQQCKKIYLNVEKLNHHDIDYGNLLSLVSHAQSLDLSFQVNKQEQYEQLLGFENGFKHLTQLTDLSIYFNSCRNPAVFNIMKQGFKQIPSLKKLNITLQFCQIQEDVYSPLIESLLNEDSLLEQLFFILLYSELSQNVFHIISSQIKKVKNLKKLGIHVSNLIGPLGATDLAQILLNIPNLVELDLNFGSDIRFFGKNGLITLSQAIGKINTLTKLKFQLSNNNVEQEGLIEFVEQIQKLTELTNLNLMLTETNVVKEFSTQLGTCLGSLTKLTALFLNLILKDIGHSLGQQIGKSFKNLNQLKIFKLNIHQSCNIGQIGAISIGESLKDLPNLQNLWITINNNEIGPNGVAKIGEGLKGLVNLQTLQLLINKNQYLPYGAEKLGEGFKNLTNLISLNIKLQNDCLIEKEGAIALGKGLSYLKQLQHLYISLELVEIFDEGMNGLSEGIGEMIELRNLELFLFGNKLTVKGYSYFGQQVKKLVNLQSALINIRNMYFTSEELQNSISGFKYLQNIKKIYLGVSFLSIMGIEGQFEHIPSLEFLQIKLLKFLQPSDEMNETLTKLTKHLSKIESLRVLDFAELFKEQNLRDKLVLMRKMRRLINITQLKQN